MDAGVKNLYAHFPFCRGKCAYCALYSKAGRSAAELGDYAAAVARSLESLPSGAVFDTVYFGGGSPCLCDLDAVFGALAPHLASGAEFTVEMHPLDVTDGKLESLVRGGVNRLSIGVQSLDDGVLSSMGRACTFGEIEAAVLRAKGAVDNTGIDLIAGYPGAPPGIGPRAERLAGWGLRHLSLYSLMLEEGSVLALKARRGETEIPDDGSVMDSIRESAQFLSEIGLERYEISNYAAPGFECRHNMAVWHGEDYYGLGEGAHGRVGLERTENAWFAPPGIPCAKPAKTDVVDPERDRIERTVFALRTSSGMDASAFPEWTEKLQSDVSAGLLRMKAGRYVLTARGTEVCDSIIADLL